MRHTRIVALLLSLVVAALTEAGAAPSQTKVIFLGDSLTEGYGVPKSASFPSLIAAELQRKGRSDVVVINAGVSGSTTASGLSRLKWHLNGQPKPKVLVLALGANDGL